jgi:prepilin-type processing-associated H-X9-DG protein
LWTNPAAPFPKNLPTGSYAFCYAMNAWLHPDPRQPPARIYDVEAPGATFFLAETAGTLPWATVENLVYSFGPRAPHPKAQAHILFCDGHVELLPRSVLHNPAASDPAAPPAHPTWIPRPGCPRPSR